MTATGAIIATFAPAEGLSSHNLLAVLGALSVPGTPMRLDRITVPTFSWSTARRRMLGSDSPLDVAVPSAAWLLAGHLRASSVRVIDRTED